MINHPFAQHQADEIRFRYRAAIDALEELEKSLKVIARGDYVGDIPGEVLAAYLYDTDDGPLSMPPNATAVLGGTADDVVRLIEAVTESIRLPA